MEKRVIYYTDELKDEFSTAKIKAVKIDGSYRYDRTKGGAGLIRFILYRLIATPLAYIYTKIVLHQHTVNGNLLKPFRKKGFFMYGNHTNVYGDPLMPNIFGFPKNIYFIVHPNNVSMPFLGKINRYLGAIPLPDDIAAAKNFRKCIDNRIENGDCVVIYPEAHIWPYYTRIRPFPDTSFGYPVKLGAPVFCFTNTYQKRRFGKKPKIVTYIDGPFFPDESLPKAGRILALRNIIYNKMCERAQNSNVEYIVYKKKEV